MSTTTLDPLDRLLEAAESGTAIIRNREVLRSDYMPKMIRHRDEEQELVAQTLLPILKRARPSNLLVYGRPGTGKTLVVRRVLLKIQERAATGDFPIRLVYANSKNETTMYALLVSFGRQLGLNEKRIPTTGLSISEVFKRLISEINKRSINAVFVIDEIDHLARLTSKSHKDILYQMTRANELLDGGSLTLVGISNDLAFKDGLDPRVISSLGEEEIVFASYTTDQIRRILEERITDALIGPNTVEEAALHLCAAKAGSEHGDARRAIDTLRVAAEAAERAGASTISQDHVLTAAAKMEERKEVAALRSYPLHEKLLVIAVMKSSGASTGEIYAAYRDLCRRTGQKNLTQRRATQMLSEIEMSGIASGRITHQGMHGRTKKFKLLVATETVTEAFGEDLALSDLL